MNCNADEMVVGGVRFVPVGATHRVSENGRVVIWRRGTGSSYGVKVDGQTILNASSDEKAFRSRRTAAQAGLKAMKVKDARS